MQGNRPRGEPSKLTTSNNTPKRKRFTQTSRIKIRNIFCNTGSSSDDDQDDPPIPPPKVAKYTMDDFYEECMVDEDTEDTDAE